ncbi:hypothetical protein SOVF_035620 [Spinacia oleracea]|uniref:Mavicyanin-like n=1 Tax=Spinacia oleracea TaxID=3562 RepID=A0A9R0JI88_SPIOL|nr:mavicyanin-like [Spinacia oleracea]XP_056699160.1 mavicyanin-like [Spinacia oleracea]KNA22266.1 hypothetical protein SOVF_035620 [Spinacia oleracea]
MTNPAATPKVVMLMLIMSAILKFRCASSAVNHVVGDSSGWDLSSNISLWSASTTFYVNDSLVFNYTPDHDVIEVVSSDFATCRITSPVSSYDDVNGQTVILLSQPGSRYFICGRPRHCSMGLKLSVQVLYQLDQSNNTSSNHNTAVEGDNHGPYSSHGYSDLSTVSFSRLLLHLGITIIGIMWALCLC